MSVSGRVADEVDKRLAEFMGSAGLRQSEIALAVLYLLPKDFRDAYEALYHRALKVEGDKGARESWIELKGDDEGMESTRLGGVGKASGARRSRLKEGETLGGMAGASGGKTYKRAWTIADEKALEMKSRVDKRLRKMARELRGFLEEAEGGAEDRVGEQKQCRGKNCKKFLDSGFKYCPWCGTRAGKSGGGG